LNQSGGENYKLALDANNTLHLMQIKD